MDKTEEKEGPDLDRIGLFKEMSYLEYIPPKIDFNEASKKGKQMMTNCAKSKNATQDGYFDASYPRVFEGEAYMDPIRLRRLHRLEQDKKIREGKFLFSNPPKKPCGSGSNYGTFDDYVGKTEYFSSHPRDVEESSPPKKNFYVNPGKKGTGYGYPNLTIAKVPPYFLDEEYEELKNAEHTPKRPEARPFEPYRAGLFQQEYFDTNPYRNDEELPPQDEEEEKEEEEKKPIFVPTNPAKKDGGMKAGCLNKFPEYKGEPYPKADLVPRGVKRHVNKENQMFRPVPGPKPYPIRSIITKNVER
ncbi:UPF0602 protein C4orf47 [Araneus ventricosus]|uniref:Cilia-and flagella-associated protein 96 n=1 Tax=Araneus ventricosus TaxID=182803 RepID=A0A4Y2KM38_ARAVE|nr:UPF0602 protein C4orf47 [Araneus ventricosus]